VVPIFPIFANDRRFPIRDAVEIDTNQGRAGLLEEGERGGGAPPADRPRGGTPPPRSPEHNRRVHFFFAFRTGRLPLGMASFQAAQALARSAGDAAGSYDTTMSSGTRCSRYRQANSRMDSLG
jgi:hypothetical protein